jgi:hypothetical protein
MHKLKKVFIIVYLKTKKQANPDYKGKSPITGYIYSPKYYSPRKPTRYYFIKPEGYENDHQYEHWLKKQSFKLIYEKKYTQMSPNINESTNFNLVTLNNVM